MVFVNASELDVPVPEPVPDWPQAEVTWKWGWHFHNYLFGCLYFLLCLYSIVSAFEFRRRLKVQRYLLTINLILLLLGVSRAAMFFVDPYESTGQLPTPLSRVFYGIAFPCLTSSFSLIQMVFMRITRVKMGPNKLQNYRVLAAIITTHFTIVIVVDVTVAYRNNLKLLLLLCQSVFITWGLILCFGFVYGGFKMSQFTSETQRVLKQLAVYHRVKQETLKDGNRRDLALHRISKPKIRTFEDESRFHSYGSDTSVIESSDSLSFYNEATLDLEEEEEALARTYLARFDKGYRKHRGCLADKSQLHLAKSLSENLSSESDYVTESPSTAGQQFSDVNSPSSTQKCDTTTPDNEGFEEVDLELVQNSSSTTTIFTVEHEVNGFINRALDLQGESSTSRLQCRRPQIRARDKRSKQNGFIKNIEFKSLQQDDPEEERQETRKTNDPKSENGQVQLNDNGYMADTEHYSPRRSRRKVKGRRGKMKPELEEEEEKEEAENSTNNSPTHFPYPLPLTEGTVSLYRIRQGRMLHKTLKISYCTTLLGFICCVLELYAMFGVYGVLSTASTAEPWPWYVFHTFFR